MAKELDKEGLARSKQALPGKRINLFLMDPKDLTIIGLDTDDGPSHPHYDERIHYELKPGFIENIREFGILMDVRVVKADGKVIVVDGRQRVRAARVINEQVEKLGGGVKIGIPVRNDVGDCGRMIAKGVSANAHRHADSPIVSAKKAQRLIEYGADMKTVANSFNVSEGTVANWLALLSAPKEVREQLASGEVSANQVLDGLRTGEVVSEHAPRQVEVREGEGTKKDVLKPTMEPRKRGPERGARPTTKMLRTVLDNGAGKLGDGFEQALRWMLGDIDAKAAGVASLLNKEPKQKKDKGLERREMIREVMTEEWSYTKDIAEAAGLPRPIVSAELKVMFEAGEVEADGERSGRSYRLVK